MDIAIMSKIVKVDVNNVDLSITLFFFGLTSEGK